MSNTIGTGSQFFPRKHFGFGTQGRVLVAVKA